MRQFEEDDHFPELVEDLVNDEDYRATLPKLLIVGMGRAGKDTAGEWFADNTVLRYGGSTSLFLAEHVAKKLGVSAEEAYRRRHESDEMRMLWFDTGNEIRNNDPLALVNRGLELGEVVAGIRDPREMAGIKKAELFDLIVWIEKDVPLDKTVKFTRMDADIIIENNGTKEQFYDKLRKLARTLLVLNHQNAFWVGDDIGS